MSDTVPLRTRNGNHSIPQVSGIYKITNTINGKFYIGSAINLQVRRQDHYSTLRRNTHANPHLQRAFNKYGEDAFTFEIIEFILIPEMLTAREQYWFKKMKPFGRKGYNIAPVAGSCLGKKHTPETREKLRQFHLGRGHTPETREKLRQANLGKKLTPEQLENRKGRVIKDETRAKLRGRKWTPEQRANLKAIKNTPEALEKNRQAHLGKSPSPETREKLRQANLGKKMSPEAIEKSWANRRAKQKEATSQDTNDNI